MVGKAIGIYDLSKREGIDGGKKWTKYRTLRNTGQDGGKNMEPLHDTW